MLFSLSLIILFLSSFISAAPFEHGHHKHIRRNAEPDANADTVYVTNVVMINQYGSQQTQTTQPTLSLVLNNNNIQQEAASIQTTLQTQISPSSTSIVYVATSSSSSSSSAQGIIANTSSSSSSSSSLSTPSSSSSSSSNFADGSVGAYASQGKGITYSPYSNSGGCKSSSEIESDMSLLSSFDIIRIYAPDCNVISSMLNSINSNQKIFAGLFYLDSLQTDIQTLASQITSSTRGWDSIYAISIGNEWINSNTYDINTVIGAISTGRSLLKQQGYNGLVVTVDTVPAYQNNPSLCTASDFVAVNQHAFWNGAIEPENSGQFIQNSITEMENLCNKDVLICETGWPTQGQTYGTCVPGKSQQLAAIKSIAQTVADKVIFFTTYNDLWKSAGQNGVEPYWGIFD
jgi:exo-beta-1,3-glucanase (GH17 family)